jgi:hypothetical protein
VGSSRKLKGFLSIRKEAVAGTKLESDLVIRDLKSSTHLCQRPSCSESQLGAVGLQSVTLVCSALQQRPIGGSGETEANFSFDDGKRAKRILLDDAYVGALLEL